MCGGWDAVRGLVPGGGVLYRATATAPTEWTGGEQGDDGFSGGGWASRGRRGHALPCPVPPPTAAPRCMHEIVASHPLPPPLKCTRPPTHTHPHTAGAGPLPERCVGRRLVALCAQLEPRLAASPAPRGRERECVYREEGGGGILWALPLPTHPAMAPTCTRLHAVSRSACRRAGWPTWEASS